MKLKLVKKQFVAKNTMMFWFEPDRPVRYIAGQYIELNVPHKKPDERKSKRWFTLSSSPSEKLLAITTKLHPHRSSSFKSALSNLDIGETVPFLMPMGDFVLPKDENTPLVFVAGGIGITPYRSILKYLSDTGQKRKIELIYATSNPAEIAFEKLIEKNTEKFIRHQGTLKSADLLGYIRKNAAAIIYISGPERMVENLQKELLATGIDEFRLRVDFFHNYD